MGKKRIIDATHISSDGGHVILDLYLSNVQISKNDILLLSYDREYIELKTIIIKSEIERILWYLANRNLKKDYYVINLNSSLCLGAYMFHNKVYFHNVLLFNKWTKRNYQRLAYKVCKERNIYAQTLSSSNVVCSVQKDSVSLLPFYKNISQAINKSHIHKRIVHISSDLPHKQNHFIEKIVAQRQIREEYEIYSTVDRLKVFGIKIIPKMNNEDMLSFINSSEILINTSAQESFCLPLVEAAMLSKKIVSFNAAYVNEVVDNVYLFNTQEELIEILKNDVNKKARIKIKNNLNNLNEIL